MAAPHFHNPRFILVSFAAITIPHKYSHLKHKFIIYTSVDEKSKMSFIGLKSRCCWGCIPFWRLQRKSHFLAFNQLTVIAWILWLVASPFIFKSQWLLKFAHDAISLVLILFSFSPLRSLVITLASARYSRIIYFQVGWIVALISSANLIPSCHVTYWQVLRVRMWTSLGAIALPTTSFIA